MDADCWSTALYRYVHSPATFKVQGHPAGALTDTLTLPPVLLGEAKAG